MQHIPGHYREDKKSYVDSVAAEHLNLSLRTAIEPARRVAYRFDALLVVLTQTGEIRYSTGRRPQTIHHRRGDILLVPRDVAVYTDYLQPTLAAPLACITLEIDEATIVAAREANPPRWPDAEDYGPLYALDDIDAFTRADAAAAIGRVDRLLRADAAVPGRAALIETISRELMLYAMQSRARAALLASAAGPSRLSALVRYIEAHLSADLDTVVLARRCHMSRSSFYERFVATFGQTPAAFVRERRIERAKSLLMQAPAVPLAGIAAECGFGNVSHFVHTFRRHTGLAPATFRRESLR
jgi:AraC-like DNA-binding protein